MYCQQCIWSIVVGDGWRYCIRNGVWVGDSDSCSGFWRGEDWLSFVSFYNTD